MNLAEIERTIIGAVSKNCKRVNFPKEITKDLAEEIGTHIGDGCLLIRQRKKFTDYTYSICCGMEDLNYLSYLRRLILKTFGLNPSYIKTDKRSYQLVYCSKALVLWKKQLGLPVGRKENIKMPYIIEQSNFVLDCVREIADTDGCLMFKNKTGKYSYPVIKIEMKSKPLILQLKRVLESYNFRTSVQLDVPQIRWQKVLVKIFYGLTERKILKNG